MLNNKRTLISDIKLVDRNQEVVVYGWIKTIRNSKDIFFIELNDGSCFESLQLISGKDFFLSLGMCIRAIGTIVRSPAKEQEFEMQVKEIEIIGNIDKDYPIQKKVHGMEFLREYPHLRPKTNTFYAVFKIRSKLAYLIHNYFQVKNFTYIHTPIITINDCEGGSEAFQVTNLDLKKDIDYNKDFFKQQAYLTVSGQLEAEPFALSHNAVYTFGPTFRADPSDTPRHAAEFWMIEPEMALYDLEDLIILIEDFIKHITLNIKDYCLTEIEFFEKYIEPKLHERYDCILNNKFEKIQFSEAIKILQESNKKFKNYPLLDKDLSIEHERFLVDEYFKKPVFVINYPKSFKSFYMRINNDNNTVSCVDLLLPGIGEIISGSQREERYDILKKRMMEKNMDLKLYRWYLETRRWGTAPHSGFGLGFERILMYLTGIDNIKDVIPYPRAARKIY